MPVPEKLNAVEDSLSTQFDAAYRVWRADQFAYAFWGLARDNPTSTLLDAYRAVYLAVPGSHVSVYNMFAFGDLGEVSLSQFIAP